jgi:hypothetical protein
MAGQRGAVERLSRLQAAIVSLVAEGERLGEGGAYGWGEILSILRRFKTSHYLAMSFKRSIAGLVAKGLIEPIPYFYKGERSGNLWGLTPKGRALVRARRLAPGGLADGHPSCITIS